MAKTIQEINERIRAGDAVVVGADEMPHIVAERGLEKAAKDVDVVTTGTFGAMCSSGAFLNFGHSDPPIKIQKCWLNEVEAYSGLAAVDAYIGATELSQDRGMEYGGGHVIEDLVAGKRISLRANSYGTDCYPANRVETELTLEDLNQAYLFNPRNNYQRYAAAANSSGHRIRTYMGTLLPELGNVNFAGTGHISPLLNDPEYRTIGFGTHIFLGGARGRIVGEGTQHNPGTGWGTLAVKGDLEGMDTDFIRGAVIPEYGTSLLIGIGIPIPILDEEIAKSTAVTNDRIETNLLDYGIARRDRPILKKVTYEQLLTGHIEVEKREIRTSSLSSFKIAKKIMKETASWIKGSDFRFCEDIERLPCKREVKPMRVSVESPKVSTVMTKKVHTAPESGSLKDVSKLMIDKGVDQVPIVDGEGRLAGIVTSFDFLKAHARQKDKAGHVMTRSVITSSPGETIDEVSRRLQKHGYNSTPVIDGDGRVVGIITLTDINRAYGRLKR